MNFVNHCYVDTEVEMKEIYTSNHIWNLFEDFTVDMARVHFSAVLTLFDRVPVTCSSPQYYTGGSDLTEWGGSLSRA